MGGVVTKAANDVGSFLGNAFTAPFKSILGRSCEDVCSGPWDVTCFIEHLCISDLAKLLMISGLCYIILMFFYLLFKLGVCQCVIRGLYKMCCAACETYWCAIRDSFCFLWHKLASTKRVRRRRRYRDIEAAVYSSSDESDFSGNYRHINASRKRNREGKMNRAESSHHHHHHVKRRTNEVSVHLRGRSRRAGSSRKLQIVRRKKPPRKIKIFKKRRLR